MKAFSGRAILNTIILILTLVLCGSFASAQTASTIWSFSGTDGDFPVAPVIFDSTGAIYGATSVGGPGKFGTVFQLEPPQSPGGAWTENILYSLQGGFDGQQPGDVVFGPKGVLFSTSYLGGSNNCYMGCGTVFELTPPSNGGEWTHTIIYDFLGGADGQAPGNLKVGPGPALYGVTPSGGPPAPPKCKDFGCGTVFQMTLQGGVWTKTILHTFSGSTDGTGPNADIVFDSRGNIYGTTYNGGNSNYGIVFELTPAQVSGGAWTETILHTFTGASDGGYPIGGLTVGPDGTIYGTGSYSGTANDSGTAFELTPPTNGGTWTYTVLHSFAGGSDGATPATTMALDPAGNLYGTTWNGGSSACYLGCGTIFRLSPPKAGGEWTETIVKQLGNSLQNPDASIVVFHNGALYGTTEFFGSSNLGSVFSLSR
jgi:uncharacterized repeat protein (TIGR03803 family)